MSKKDANSDGFKIRPFADGDRDALVALWEACGLTTPWNDPDEDIALLRETPTSEIFVGERDGRLIASACVGYDGHRGWIYYLLWRRKSRATAAAQPCCAISNPG